jgi:hypothetical protein
VLRLPVDSITAAAPQQWTVPSLQELDVCPPGSSCKAASGQHALVVALGRAVWTWVPQQLEIEPSSQAVQPAAARPPHIHLSHILPSMVLSVAAGGAHFAAVLHSGIHFDRSLSPGFGSRPTGIAVMGCRCHLLQRVGLDVSIAAQSCLCAVCTQ